MLHELRADFPDVSISKIRFLEAEGLVAPQRTPSGYRTFSAQDIDRLRYILTAQRDKMDAVVEQLKIVETLDAKQLDAILAQESPAASSTAS